MWMPTPPTPQTEDKENGIKNVFDEKDKFVAVRKNYGPCREMLGKIETLVVFVSTPSFSWTQEEITSYCKDMDAAMGKLNEQAKRRSPGGRQTQFGYSLFRCQTSFEFDKSEEKWFGDVMKNFFHLGTIAELHDYYSARLHADSTPFIFLFNSDGRGYARPSRSDYRNQQNEYAVCFGKEKDRTFTVMHELMHLYGAVDLYYPEEVKDAAWKYMPSSVMLRREGVEIDDLTSYLIGWGGYKPTVVKIFSDIFEKYKGQY